MSSNGTDLVLSFAEQCNPSLQNVCRIYFLHIKNFSCLPDASNLMVLSLGGIRSDQWQKRFFFFYSIMIQCNLELLPSCETQAYGELVCICSLVNQSQVPKWLLLVYSQLRLTKDWYLFLVQGSFPRNVCISVYALCWCIYECVRANHAVCFWLCGTLQETRIQVFMCRSSWAFWEGERLVSSNYTWSGLSLLHFGKKTE